MGLAQMQHALARLYTDAQLRQRFVDCPAQIARSFELTREEADQLASIASRQIIQFANSLQKKRADEVRNLLPLTSRALGHLYSSLFASHAAEYAPFGVRKHQDDAAAYVKWLGRSAAANQLPSWLLEIARWEAAPLRRRRGAIHVGIQLFRHDLRPIVSWLQRGEHIKAVPWCPSIALSVSLLSLKWHVYRAMPLGCLAWPASWAARFLSRRANLS